MSFTVSWTPAFTGIMPADGGTTADTTPLLDWADVTGAVKYQVQVSAANTFATSIIDENMLTESQATVSTALANNSTYYWRVKTQNGDGVWGDWSMPWSFTVDMPEAGSPNPARGSTTVDTTPLLDWVDVAGAGKYQVQVSDASTLATIIVDTNTLTESQYTFGTVLANNTTWYWRVKAKNDDGVWGDWSPTWSFTVTWVDAITPSNPADTGSTTDTTPVLDWPDVTGAVSYYVQVAATEAALAVATPVPVAISQYEVMPPLAIGDVCYWRVRAVNEDGLQGVWNATWSFSVVPILTMKTVIASGGTATFNMGSTAYGESPVHSVTLTQPFSMSMYEVTNAQFVDVMNWAIGKGYAKLSGGSLMNAVDSTYYLGLTYMDSETQFGIQMSGSNIAVKNSRDTHPVVGVTWYGALAFCNFLSEREGLETVYNLTDWSATWTQKGYRLPTEAEWEYSARGTDGRIYPWGNMFDASYANYFDSGDTYDLYPYTTNGLTTPVGYYDGTTYGTFATHNGASPFGVHDMAGNVSEWCWDWYGSYTSGSQTDPHGAASGSSKVLRGGYWGPYSDGNDLRSAYRTSTGGGPTSRSAYNGFRPARTYSVFSEMNRNAEILYCFNGLRIMAQIAVINSDGSYSQHVSGESHYHRELSKICGGKNAEGHEHHTTAILILEDESKFDKNAVRVKVEGLKVGYIPKEDAKGIRKFLSDAGAVGMEQDTQANAIIRGGWKREGGDEGDFGVVIDIAWRD